MSFWNVTDESILSEAQQGNFDANPDIAPIPSNTILTSMIVEASFETTDEAETYISIHWEVVDGEYKGRHIFQKLRTSSLESKKRDKAIAMLVAINANAQGRLLEIPSPTDSDLMANLCNKVMKIMVKVWSMENPDGTKSEGNWVSKVASMSAASQPQSAGQVQQQANSMPGF